MNFGRFGDKQQLIAVISVLLVIGFAVTVLVNYQVSKSAIRKSIVASELPLTSDNLYSEIQKDLVRPVVISSMMASDTFLRDWVLSGEGEVDKVTRYLLEVKDRYSAFTTFFISERTRTYYQTGGVLKKISQDEPRDAWYFRVRAMNTPYEINIDPDQANKDITTIFINYRVLDYAGRFIGVTGIGLTMDAARTLIDIYQKRYGRDVYFVDRQGRVALGSNAHPQGSDIRKSAGLGDIADAILRKGSGPFQYMKDGRERLLNVRLIPELNWYLFVEGSDDEAMAGVRTTLYTNLAVGILITLIVLLVTSVTINRYQSRLEEMATTDKLTGLSNRQAFDLLIPQAISESRRSGSPLCLLMIDIDNFKDVNDSHGHLAGDKVLHAVARAIKASLRASDIVCRWGGEEFLVALKSTDLAQAQTLAEKIRRTLEAAGVPHKTTRLSFTTSIGISAWRNGDTPERLISRADEALYLAKKQGRNRVQVETPPAESNSSIFNDKGKS